MALDMWATHKTDIGVVLTTLFTWFFTLLLPPLPLLILILLLLRTVWCPYTFNTFRIRSWSWSWSRLQVECRIIRLICYSLVFTLDNCSRERLGKGKGKGDGYRGWSWGSTYSNQQPASSSSSSASSASVSCHFVSSVVCVGSFIAFSELQWLRFISHVSVSVSVFVSTHLSPTTTSSLSVERQNV